MFMKVFISNALVMHNLFSMNHNVKRSPNVHEIKTLTSHSRCQSAEICII